jgi:rod shape-determining protein MreD
VISLNAQTILRLTGLAVAVVLIQTSVIAPFEFLGTNADLMPLVVAAVGLMCGALAGSCFGFGLGVVADLILGGTMGVSSLVYIAIGYGAGRVRDLRDPDGSFVAPAVGAGATLASLAGFGLVSFVLGIDAPVSALLAWEVIVSVAINALVAIPAFAVVRRVVAPILPDDPRGRRRRRAYTTGGLSPIGRDE